MSTFASLPPDRGHVETEHRHEGSMELDALGTRQFIALLVDDHRCVADAALAARDSLTAFIDALVPRVRAGGRLIYFGAGTSGRLGVLDAAECPPTFQSDPNQVIGVIAGGEAALRRSSESKEDDPQGAAEALAALRLTPSDTVLGIAAGGTTPYVLGALRIAGAAGAMTGLLTCADSSPSVVPDSLEAATNNEQRTTNQRPQCDHLIHLPTGPELLTGSTRLKAGSATKLALNIISTALFTQLGKVYSNLMVDLRATNQKLTDRAIRILVMLCPELTREQAAALLERAAGNLKAAIVMQRLDVDLNAAEELINAQGGRLRTILEK